MRFYVHSEHTKEVLDRRFGGIENFVDEWASIDQIGSGLKSTKSVKTIYRWIAEGLPKNEAAFFSFFGALGVDPLSLVDLKRSKFRENFSRYRQAIMLAGIDIGGFRPLIGLMRPAVRWPDDELASTYFGRVWWAREFTHEATSIKNFHATVRLRNVDEEASNHPRAYHIAYRRKSNADGLWRPFGSIIARANETVLIHENGDMQQVSPDRSIDRVDFKTFFGPSPAEFRVASLFEFTLGIDRFDDPSVSLQFDG